MEASLDSRHIPDERERPPLREAAPSRMEGLRNRFRSFKGRLVDAVEKLGANEYAERMDDPEAELEIVRQRNANTVRQTEEQVSAAETNLKQSASAAYQRTAPRLGERIRSFFSSKPAQNPEEARLKEALDTVTTMIAAHRRTLDHMAAQDARGRASDAPGGQFHEQVSGIIRDLEAKREALKRQREEYATQADLQSVRSSL